MAVSFRYAARTDLGTVRTNNEDSALASPRLLVLADGMGGHAAGEVASTIALRMFAEVDQSEESSFEQEFPRAGRATRRILHTMSEADPILESMGTTLVAIGCDGEHLTIGHIGDSRVYLLREADLYQVTSDHTHVQHLIDTGQLTAERARTHPYRSMLLKSLDDQPTGPDMDLIAAKAEPGDRLLLCSDGLSDYLLPEEIRSAVAAPDRDEAAQALIDAALAAGTRDNVTVVVADVVTEEEGPGHPLAAAPMTVGAAHDGIALSEDASMALRHSLPDFPFHPDEPMADAVIDTPLAPQSKDAAATAPADHRQESGAEEERDGTAETDPSGPNDQHPHAAGALGHEDGPGAGHTSGHGSAAADRGPEPPAPRPDRASQLPGLLAGGAIAALVILLFLVLG